MITPIPRPADSLSMIEEPRGGPPSDDRTEQGRGTAPTVVADEAGGRCVAASFDQATNPRSSPPEKGLTHRPEHSRPPMHSDHLLDAKLVVAVNGREGGSVSVTRVKPSICFAWVGVGVARRIGGHALLSVGRSESLPARRSPLVKGLAEPGLRLGLQMASVKVRGWPSAPEANQGTDMRDPPLEGEAAHVPRRPGELVRRGVTTMLHAGLAPPAQSAAHEESTGRARLEKFGECGSAWRVLLCATVRQTGFRSVGATRGAAAKVANHHALKHVDFAIEAGVGGGGRSLSFWPLGGFHLRRGVLCGGACPLLLGSPSVPRRGPALVAVGGLPLRGSALRVVGGAKAGGIRFRPLHRPLAGVALHGCSRGSIRGLFAGVGAAARAELFKHALTKSGPRVGTSPASSVGGGNFARQ